MISPSILPPVESGGTNDVELTNKEFVLLEHFMRHPGEVLSRTTLIEHVGVQL